MNEKKMLFIFSMRCGTRDAALDATPRRRTAHDGLFDFLDDLLDDNQRKKVGPNPVKPSKQPTQLGKNFPAITRQRNFVFRLEN